MASVLTYILGKSTFLRYKKQVSQGVTFVASLEPLIFSLLLLINIVPVFMGKFFVTLDGPAHLYNANLLRYLLTNTPLDLIYEYTPELVPNYSGHLILSLFSSFLPAFIAEKIVLCIYLIGFPLAIRNLIIRQKGNRWISYFIFPFSYSFVFLLGFYNFSLALLFMFMSINQYHRFIKNSGNSSLPFLGLAALLFATYLSHILVFGLTLIAIGLLICTSAIFGPSADANFNKWKTLKVKLITPLSKLVLAAIIPLGLSLNYFISRPNSPNTAYLDRSDLLNELWNIRTIIAYNIQIEGQYTTKLAYLFGGIIVVAIFQFIIKLVYSNYQRKPFTWPLKLYWYVGLAATLLLLVLYFVLPDSTGGAGYISVRLALLFFIFLIVWLSTFKLDEVTSIIAANIAVYYHLKILWYYLPTFASLTPYANAGYELGAQLPKHAIVLPINVTNNWLTHHTSNYIGVKQPVAVLENYESGTGYFPIKWNQEKMPNLTLAGRSNHEVPCLYWPGNTDHKELAITHVFILGDTTQLQDSCTREMIEFVTQNAQLIGQRELGLLYALTP